MSALKSKQGGRKDKLNLDAHLPLRRSEYIKNCKRIEKDNQSNLGFTQELNEFAVMTPEEFAAHNGLVVPMKEEEAAHHGHMNSSVPFFGARQALPATVDWRTKGVVTPVKDQGQCASCWAFSANGALESAMVLQGKKPLVALSEQELLDCTGYGCGNSFMDKAYAYVKEKKLSKEASYTPYAQMKTACAKSGSTLDIGACVISWNWVSGEENLKKAVAEIGPIAASICSSSSAFRTYSSGVFYDPTCPTNAFNHGITIVGYGTDPVGGDYWLVKNSWGSWWGDNGYVKMARNRNNLCGIATWALYPTVCSGSSSNLIPIP